MKILDLYYLFNQIRKLNAEDKQDICELIQSLDNDHDNLIACCKAMMEILQPSVGRILPLLSAEEMKLERTRLHEIEAKYSTEDGPTEAEYKEAQELVKKVYYHPIHNFGNGFWLRDDTDIRRGIFEVEQAYSLFYKSPADGSRRVHVFGGPLDWAIKESKKWIKENGVNFSNNCCPQ